MTSLDISVNVNMAAVHFFEWQRADVIENMSLIYLRSKRNIGKAEP